MLFSDERTFFDVTHPTPEELRELPSSRRNPGRIGLR